MNNTNPEAIAAARRYILTSICIQWRFRRFLAPSGILSVRPSGVQFHRRAESRGSREQPPIISDHQQR